METPAGPADGTGAVRPRENRAELSKPPSHSSREELWGWEGHKGEAVICQGQRKAKDDICSEASRWAVNSKKSEIEKMPLEPLNMHTLVALKTPVSKVVTALGC